MPYVVAVEAEYGSDWDVILWSCSDFESALRYAIGIAKWMQGRTGTPLIRIRCHDGTDRVWCVEQLLTFAHLIGD
jgi:hypothetical protein